MKTMLEVCMYSGICHRDPRCEITPEQEKILMEKLSKLHKPATADRFGTGTLGADSFMVLWGVLEIEEDGFTFDNECAPTQFKYSMIRSLPGRITIISSENGLLNHTLYEDTEAIHSFLTDLATPAIQAHYKKSNEEMQGFWDHLVFKE